METTVEIPSILQTRRNDMAFCPGCSHARVLESLAQVIKKMSLGPERVCLVSDIGCIGISDRYFSCHTFHGLHGRSVTYAEGIKRTRPDLTVIVLVGDGGCGIGTSHLVHAARRGVDVTVLACNNFNFGMTGGQHSPTTPPCGLTVTTPHGASEHVLDICNTVAANGAAYVARCSAYDRECTNFIEAAMRTPGFALLDIWELCVAHYVGTNKLNPTALNELSQSLNLPFGVIAQSQRRRQHPAELAAPTSHAEAASANRDADGPTGLKWSGRTEIVVAGSAGQRVRSACGVIGELVTAGGSYAAQLDDFPITVRKGFSVSYLVLSERPIRYAGVDNPDLLVLLSDDGLRRVGNLADLDARCRVYLDRSLTTSPEPPGGRRFTLHDVEKDVGKAGAALAVLARALIECGWTDGAALEEAASRSLKGRHRADQLRAIEWAGRASGRERGAE